MGRQKREIPKGRFRLKTDGQQQSDKLFQVVMEYAWNTSVITSCRNSEWG